MIIEAGLGLAETMLAVLCGVTGLSIAARLLERKYPRLLEALMDDPLLPE